MYRTLFATFFGCELDRITKQTLWQRKLQSGILLWDPEQGLDNEVIYEIGNGRLHVFFSRPFQIHTSTENRITCVYVWRKGVIPRVLFSLISHVNCFIATRKSTSLGVNLRSRAIVSARFSLYANIKGAKAKLFRSGARSRALEQDVWKSVHCSIGVDCRSRSGPRIDEKRCENAHQ
jgi:hypothetical protein